MSSSSPVTATLALDENLTAATEALARMREALASTLTGKPEVVSTTVIALFAGGHLLVEDVPGVGKTLLARSVAAALSGTFSRVQGTPDLLPAELTGTLEPTGTPGGWSFRPGPVFANVLLVDEINRMTPRCQSALLEAFAERQVSQDGVSHALPTPFFAIATENPFEHHGTFPLVEGQRDRFLASTEIGYPSSRTETELLLGVGGTGSLEQLTPVVTPAELAAAQTACRSLFVADEVASYVVALARATRDHREIELGASPRAALDLLAAAKVQAVVAERDFVTPDDVAALAPTVFAHRLQLVTETGLEDSQSLVERIVFQTPSPA